MPCLIVSRIDPEAETARYRENGMRSMGKDLDAEGLAMLEEDLRSPCTEEIAGALIPGRKCAPHRGVIRGFFLAPWFFVDIRIGQPISSFGAK